jgi:toxin HigB-1
MTRGRRFSLSPGYMLSAPPGPFGECLTVMTRCVTMGLMIRSFRDRETERVFQRLGSRRLSAAVVASALRKLLILDGADSLQDLRVPPGNRLESLQGDRQGQLSIRVNDQWRICFRWSEGDAYDVEITDYH